MLSPLYGQLSPLRVPTKAVRLVQDSDALAYIAAVETVDAQELEDSVKYAYEDFITGCKSDGIWSALKASCILAGARTLSGALVPLVGSAPTNNNFVSGDYNRETGLKGNGSTKYLDSNRNNDDDPQDDNHYASFVSQVPSVTGAIISSTGNSGSNAGTILLAYDVNNGLSSRNKASNVGLKSGFGVGLKGITRFSSNSYIARNAASSSSVLVASNGSGVGMTSLQIFRRLLTTGSASIWFNGRLSFYSVGESLDLAALDTRVSTLMTDLAAAIP